MTLTHSFSPCFTGFFVFHCPEPEHRGGEGRVRLSSGQEAEIEERTVR